MCAPEKPVPRIHPTMPAPVEYCLSSPVRTVTCVSTLTACAAQPLAIPAVVAPGASTYMVASTVPVVSNPQVLASLEEAVSPSRPAQVAQVAFSAAAFSALGVAGLTAFCV